MCIIKNKNSNLSFFQKQLAKKLLVFVKGNKKLFQKTKNAETLYITYGDVSEYFWNHRLGGRSLRIPAGYVSEFCMRHNLPPLTAILCNINTELPGLGFDEMFNNNMNSVWSQNFWNWSTLTSQNRKEKIHKIQTLIYKCENWTELENNI